MISSNLLPQDLARLATLLGRDLRERARTGTATAALADEYEHLRAKSLISATWHSWLDEKVAQVAAAWVLATAIVRFCEDNELLDSPAIVGAEDGAHAREVIINAVDRLSSQPTMAQVFSRRTNPMWRIEPSQEACAALLAFWNLRSPDGLLVHDFTDESRGTRFLLDLYSGLNEQARTVYGSVPTPEFVVTLILDLTLDPALDTFAPSLSALQEFRAIDPACGSGNFLIGAFDRLFRRWTDIGSDMSPWQRAARALRSLHGCDIDPCAVSITRFRLLIAAMNATGERRLDDVPDLPIVVTAADALIKGLGTEPTPSLFRSEPDPTESGPEQEFAEYADRHGLFGPDGYDVVVSNPPAVTVKDKALFATYRDAYQSCSGRYALTVPFTELAFLLTRRKAGHVGQLLANSFMKREFGQQLVERVLTQVEISHVIDTSGAYIPGHGAPTAILVGQSRTPDPARPVHVVVGRRGEPEAPENPGEGLVWQSLRRMSCATDVADLWAESFLQDRGELAAFPWNLADSSVRDLLHHMERGERLRERVARIGYGANTGSDDAFCAPAHSFDRHGTEKQARVQVLTGSGVRDWGAHADSEAFFTRGGKHLELLDLDQLPGHSRRLWPYKSDLSQRAGIKKRSQWYDWHQVAPAWNVHPWSITFPWVSTHPHFSLLRGSLVPLNSAPVIKLPPNASDTEHLQLLGVLNSSAVCFWLKQMSQSKGQPRAGQLRGGESWEKIYEFTSTRLLDLPLPGTFPAGHAEELDRLATQLTAYRSEMSAPDTRLTPEYLASAERRYAAARARMVSLQEELDWQVYGMYGLLPDDSHVTGPLPDVPAIEVGRRAFEIVLARQVASGESSSTWFERHGVLPVTEPPRDWPPAYRDLVQRRIEAISGSPVLALLEQAEYKHRWSVPDWPNMVQATLRDRMLDLCESPGLWHVEENGRSRPVTHTVRELAELLEEDGEFVALASLYAPEARFLDTVRNLIADTHVPAAAALRYKASGLAKRRRWEVTWEQQWRQEQARGHADDQGPGVGNGASPVPPRFTSADFLKPSYWQQRGKLDIPNERFTSYLPPFSPLSSTTVIGWAGWDAEERARALLGLLESSAAALAQSPESALPLLAALQEVLPWVPRTGCGLGPVEPSHAYDEMRVAFNHHQDELGVSADAIASWRPPAPKRGRPRQS
ncbi:BREX-2 system adenine-specific DNA-methyltransferase PglX [Streptomyces sp. NPDC048257]|uniref:BREX-2 system adenine-specific DNA-methyltransferase PglX n=1 Tax=Streptomyces sp. NPDC048257 TaxID=3365526 RepID=UPI0037149416